MEQRTLGNSDLRVSSVGIGCNNFGGRMNLDVAR
jgi:aryl-alcohol dehydrogenase-like predicted oxidoreductase